MLVSLSAVEYKWYTYKGKKNITFFRKKKTEDWELSLDPGEVYGVRILNDGRIAVKHEEAQNMVFFIEKEQYDSLMKMSKAHVGKIDKPTEAVEEVGVIADKNNIDSYEHFVYTHPKRGVVVYNSLGTKIGTVRKGDTFALFSENPTKGGWFWAIQSDNVKIDKPVKVKADIFATLEVNSKKADNDSDDEIEDVKPSGRKPTVEDVKPSGRKPTVEDVKPSGRKPTVEDVKPSGNIPNVADLKPLHDKVNSVIKSFQAIGKQNIATFEDFEEANEALKSIKNVDVVEIKKYMHSIGVSTEMATILLKTLKANYDQSVAIIVAKKKSVKDDTVEDDFEQVDGSIELGKVKVKFASLQESAKIALKDKFNDIAAVENEEELDHVIGSLKSIYSDYETRIKAQGKKEGIPSNTISKVINDVKEKYLTFLEKLNDRKTSFIKSVKDGEEESDEDLEPDVDDIDDLDDYDVVKPTKPATPTKPTNDISSKLSKAFDAVNVQYQKMCDASIKLGNSQTTEDAINDTIDSLVETRTAYLKSVSPYSALPNYNDRKAVLKKFDDALAALESKIENLNEDDEQVDAQETVSNLKALGESVTATLENLSKKARVCKTEKEVQAIISSLDDVYKKYLKDAQQYSKLFEYKAEVDELADWFSMYKDELNTIKLKFTKPTKPTTVVDDDDSSEQATQEDLDDFYSGFEDSDTDFKPVSDDLVPEEEDEVDPFDGYDDISDIFGGGKLGARPGDEDEE